MWPAFWLLPASGQYTSELDVFEQSGNDPNTIHSTAHGSTGGQWNTDVQPLHVANTSTGFHTFGVNWEPKAITVLFDGHAVATAPTPASMNSPMFMLLNLAVGGAGSWPGVAAASSIPAALKIQRVRAYATANSTNISGTRALIHEVALLPGATMQDWSAGSTALPVVTVSHEAAVRSRVMVHVDQMS